MMKTNTLGEVRVCSSRSNFKPYLLALIILPLFSLASHSDTLKQSLQNAYNNSDELMLERMSVKEADESVAKAVAAKRFNLFPQVITILQLAEVSVVLIQLVRVYLPACQFLTVEEQI